MLTPPDQKPAGRVTVLVVEDEAMIALDLQTMLEDEGYDVLGPVGRVEQALSLLNDCSPDVVVLDLNLRGQLATPVGERLRTLAIPFVIASADTSSVDGHIAFAGAESVAKPVQQKHLVAALQQALGQPQR